MKNSSITATILLSVALSACGGGGSNPAVQSVAPQAPPPPPMVEERSTETAPLPPMVEERSTQTAPPPPMVEEEPTETALPIAPTSDPEPAPTAEPAPIAEPAPTIVSPFEDFNLTLGTASTDEGWADDIEDWTSTFPSLSYAHNSNWSAYGAPSLEADIKAAWSQGWTGKDVKIVIYDSSSLNHDQLVGALAGGTTWHRGEQFPGVAPEADMETVHNAIGGMKYLLDNEAEIDIVNISLTGIVGNGADYAAMKTLRNNRNILFTVAAGNKAGWNTDTAFSLTGRYYSKWNSATKQQEYFHEYDPNNATIVVGSMDANGTQIFSHANNEAFKNDFIVTQQSSPPQNLGASGTSFTAPVVAGSAALLKHKYPHLSANELKDVLLETADGRGTCADIVKTTSCADSKWGHGVLNLGSAMSPVGDLQ